MKSDLPIYFVLGTRAQFIKMAPLMYEMQKQDLPYKLIYTAQHRENIDEILDLYCLSAPDVILYKRDEATTRSSFLLWFGVVFCKILIQPKSLIQIPGILLTHGDTFTAWLAALLGRRTGCIVGHVESGLRSFNIFSPFPEELSRLITFSLTDIYFCADVQAMNNLKKYKGKKINVGANTMLDGVRYALNYPRQTSFDFEAFQFSLVSIHRFENLFTSRLKNVILPLLIEIANHYHLVITLHPVTRERLIALGLYNEMASNPNFTFHERFNFVDWINLCNKAKFVITDGGSNQEELSYLGVPTLLFRYETEREEGLKKNVVLSKFDKTIIKEFIENLDKYKERKFQGGGSPSKEIIRTICAIKYEKDE
jgi:UDP-N-acetylglucosamine 2-epimerase (non-hydrolysing)